MQADPAAIADAIRARTSTHHLLVLCDFDGTLVEFQPDPAAVWLPPVRRDLLNRLVRRHATTVGIVSGRRLDDVRARAGLGDGLYLAGLHGLEIDGGGERFVHPDVAGGRELVHGIAAVLQPALERLPGVFIEDKGLSIAVHYREAEPAAHRTVIERFDDAAAPALADGRLRVMRGAFVLELLPNTAWNKGHAVAWIVERVRQRHGPLLPVYLGDDVTDEDAFRAVRDDGIGIAASERVTGGHFRVDGPTGVEQLLRALLR